MALRRSKTGAEKLDIQHPAWLWGPSCENISTGWGAGGKVSLLLAELLRKESGAVGLLSFLFCSSFKTGTLEHKHDSIYVTKPFPIHKLTSTNSSSLCVNNKWKKKNLLIQKCCYFCLDKWQPGSLNTDREDILCWKQGFTRGYKQCILAQ